MGNKKKDNQTLLYTAGVCGHLNIVKLLISLGSDFLLRCGEIGEENSVLDSTIRWNHITIVNYYLEELKWPKEYLNKALKIYYARLLI